MWKLLKEIDFGERVKQMGLPQCQKCDAPISAGVEDSIGECATRLHKR